MSEAQPKFYSGWQHDVRYFIDGDDGNDPWMGIDPGIGPSGSPAALTLA